MTRRVRRESVQPRTVQEASEVLRSEVCKVASRLDKALPGWRGMVNKEELDMNSGTYSKGRVCGCLMAQLDSNGSDFGWYDRGMRRCSFTNSSSALVDPGWDAIIDSESTTWRDLVDPIWLKEIDRRGKSAA